MARRDPQAMLNKDPGRLKGPDSCSPCECNQADELVTGPVSGARAVLDGLPLFLEGCRNREKELESFGLLQQQEPTVSLFQTIYNSHTERSLLCLTRAPLSRLSLWYGMVGVASDESGLLRSG